MRSAEGAATAHRAPPRSPRAPRCCARVSRAWAVGAPPTPPRGAGASCTAALSPVRRAAAVAQQQWARWARWARAQWLRHRWQSRCGRAATQHSRRRLDRWRGAERRASPPCGRRAQARSPPAAPGGPALALALARPLVDACRPCRPWARAAAERAQACAGVQVHTRARRRAGR
eukprot:scaffold64232_cov68-Phaeocystis_antarctica.AAC.1